MSRGLIGYSGFVGSNLDRAAAFEYRYNSRNFRSMQGKEFDLLVCAGVSAQKWVANRDPDADSKRIDELIAVLDTITAGEFVLISTIDVYPDPSGDADESEVIDPNLNHSYGRNRYMLEQWSSHRFPGAKIVRLPALFGPGLKKNAIFDLLNDNEVEKINPAGSFQWYPVARLWADLGIVLAYDLRLVNLFPEPLPMLRIIEALFPQALVGLPRQPVPRYRLKTRYASLFGGEGGYVMSADRCFEEIAAFVHSYPAGVSSCA